MVAVLSDLKRRGFVLHPLKGKIPLLIKWQELTSTPADIDKHVEGGGNVGAVCGKASNITCIDLDSMLFADEIFPGKIETLCAERTKGRGHVYFKYNQQLPASKHHDLGIEVLSDGNNIVLPGSKHPSGDIYRWKNPDVPIQDMPAEVEANLLRLVKTETELKRILAKCRHCFRDVIKRKPDMHGSDGREMMLAICTDLKANGADEQHIKMFAKLMYREKFDEGRTMQEWRNIDPLKTWTCEMLKAKLPAYVDLAQCEKCEQRRLSFQNRSDLVPVPKIIDFNATTDLSNAKRFVQLHQRNIRYVPVWNCWVVFNGTRWVEKRKDAQIVPLVEQMITQIRRDAGDAISEDTQKKLLKHATSTESEAKIMACIRLASSQPEIQAEPDDFDKDRYLLNFKNGTLDLRTGVLHEFRREDMISRMCPVEYIPDAKYPLWQGFIEKIFAGDRDVIEYMQKFTGMAFTGDISEELFHIFHGSGSNGKTTYMNTMNKILGKQYFRTMGVETLLKRGQKAIANDIARLQGARIVWANEPEFDDILTEGKIKKMVSNEPILGEMKFKEPVEFDPEYSLILTTNPKPKVRGISEGWKRRLRFIPFSVKIRNEEKDIHFAEKLRGELSGIVNWVIEGCLKWQKEGLIPPEKILVATEDYLEETDPLAEFFKLYTIKEPQARTPFEMFYIIYDLWAMDNKKYLMSKIAFSQAMVDRGFVKMPSPAKFKDGRSFKGFEGVTLRGWGNPHQKHVNSMTSTNLANIENDIERHSEENLFETVVNYMTAPDSEKGGAFLLILPILRHLSNPFYKQCYVRKIKSVESVESVENTTQDNDSDIFHTSFKSVESVESVELTVLIKDKIKYKYDKLNKPDSIKDLERLKINIRDEIIVWLSETLQDNQDIPGDEFIDRIISDYCSVRGWH